MYKRINLTPNSRPVRKTGLLITQDDEGAVVRFSNKTENYRLNGSAIHIWQLCDGAKDFAEICQSIAEISGESAANIESDTSEVVASLISKGLVGLGRLVANPFIRVTFIDAPDSFNKLDNFFLNLFVSWFDLIIVEPDENPDFAICWKSKNSTAAEDAAVLCLVDDRCQENADYWDIVFRHENCKDETGAIVLHLPQDYIENPVPSLSEHDLHSLNSLFERAPTTTLASLEKESEPIRKKLTIGMATFDDYDGVYFTVMAIRMFHPEVTHDTEILVIDNNPGGICSKSLRSLENSVTGYRYVENNEVKGTSVRDFVFHEAQTDYVMCIDSHVFIEPGAIRKLIEFFDRNPGITDFLQGPLVHDNLKEIATHFEPVWQQGMFGIWSCDDRGKNPEAEPFEIPMQGLGLAACRKDAWPGYNRRFSGFGGEEGYIHQKFRNAGARVLCLPFLRWTHRFERPMGTRYENIWEERIRNYLIGFKEVGLDIELLKQHFCTMTSKTVVEEVIQKIKNEENNPFNFFDSIYCINLDAETGRWQKMETRLRSLGILQRVVRLSAVETPESHHIGCALSHRRAIERARKFGHKNVLVLEDDVIFHGNTLEHLSNSLAELKILDWNVFYLGGMKWGEIKGKPYRNIDGCKYLQSPEQLTCTHAVAYSSEFFGKILDELPENQESMTGWIKKHIAIDQYLTHQDRLVVMSPVVATQQNILQKEDEVMRNGFQE